MQESILPLEELRNNVTSKNGVTFAALESLKHNDFAGSIKQALEKNIERSFELREVAYKMNS
jgi:pyrroline-5-carboxylate reductase